MTDRTAPYAGDRGDFFMGDYIAVAATDTEVVAAWTDLRLAATDGSAIFLSHLPLP